MNVIINAERRGSGETIALSKRRVQCGIETQTLVLEGKVTDKT